MLLRVFVLGTMLMVMGCSKKTTTISATREPERKPVVMSAVAPRHMYAAPERTHPIISTTVTVHFAFGGDVLMESWKRGIDRSIDGDVESADVVGACCPIGTEEYNTDLGLRRAQAVREYLRGRGVSQVRISSVGEGNLVTLVRDEYWRNRRCDITMHRYDRGGSYDDTWKAGHR